MYRDSIDGLNTSPSDAPPNVFTNSLLFTRHAPVPLQDSLSDNQSFGCRVCQSVDS